MPLRTRVGGLLGSGRCLFRASCRHFLPSCYYPIFVKENRGFLFRSIASSIFSHSLFLFFFFFTSRREAVRKYKLHIFLKFNEDNKKDRFIVSESFDSELCESRKRCSSTLLLNSYHSTCATFYHRVIYKINKLRDTQSVYIRM